MQQATLPLPLPEGFSGGQIVQLPLDRIDAEDQVRTTSGYDETLDELAESISTQGVMQPILVRQAPNADRFILIAGHRRTLASALAGLEFIPAIIKQADDAEALDMQLAENVHREDLCLAEVAVVVRKLHDRLQDLGAVARAVKKSKPWVCKHLAVTYPDFSHHARHMLQSGITADIELLHTINQIDKLGIGWNDLHTLHEQIEKGKAGRKEARELLARLKVRKTQDTADKKALTERAKKAQITEKAANIVTPRENMNALHDRVLNPKQPNSVDELLRTFDQAARKQMAALFTPVYEDGKKLAGKPNGVQLRALTRIAGNAMHDESAAWLVGALGLELTLEHIVTEMLRTWRA